MAVSKLNIRSYGWALLLGGLITGLFFIIQHTPYHETYMQIHHLKRLMRLFLGGGYWLAEKLLTITPLSLVVIFVVLVLFLVWIKWLYRQRRWPSLTLVVIGLVVNWVIFGATSFVMSPYIAGEMETCEYLFDAKTTIKIRRFPIDESLVYGEQLFVLVTNDAGENWRQIFESYAVNPYFLLCENIQRNGQDGLMIHVERMIDFETNELLLLRSDDRGMTWTMQND